MQERAAAAFYPVTVAGPEIMCRRKAPYAQRKDYRGALFRNTVCEVN